MKLFFAALISISVAACSGGGSILNSGERPDLVPNDGTGASGGGSATKAPIPAIIVNCEDTKISCE